MHKLHKFTISIERFTTSVPRLVRRHVDVHEWRLENFHSQPIYNVAATSFKWRLEDVWKWRLKTFISNMFSTSLQRLGPTFPQRFKDVICPLGTFLAPFCEMTLTGVCWNCLPVSSQFQICSGLSCKLSLEIMSPKSFIYLDTTVGLSMRARDFPSFSGFSMVISGCLLLRPFHHPRPGAPFLKAATFSRLQRMCVSLRIVVCGKFPFLSSKPRLHFQLLYLQQTLEELVVDLYLCQGHFDLIFCRLW